jgi:hypothetical protein
LGKNQKINAMKNLFYIQLIILSLVSAISCSKDSNNPASALGNSQNSGSGQGGSNARFTIAGNNLFTVSNQNLTVFNINDADNPSYSGQTSVGNSIETIFGRGNTLFIGASDGMYIYDMTNPISARLIARPPHFPAHDPVVADDSFAYVTLHDGWVNTTFHSNTNQLLIYNITNLANPVQVVTRDMKHPYGLGIDNKTLFVCDDGLKIFDVSKIPNIVQKNHFLIEANDVIPNNGDLLVIGNNGLYQYQYAKDTISLLSKINIVQ